MLEDPFEGLWADEDGFVEEWRQRYCGGGREEEWMCELMEQQAMMKEDENVFGGASSGERYRTFKDTTSLGGTREEGHEAIWRPEALLEEVVPDIDWYS